MSSSTPDSYKTTKDISQKDDVLLYVQSLILEKTDCNVSINRVGYQAVYFYLEIHESLFDASIELYNNKLLLEISINFPQYKLNHNINKKIELDHKSIDDLELLVLKTLGYFKTIAQAVNVIDTSMLDLLNIK